MKKSRRNSRRSKKINRLGFTLIELMVSVAVFLVIGAAAFSLFSSHAPLFTRQQNISGLNITLRNAVTQMELDVSNAGSGYFPSADFPGWPVGVTINNNTSAGCYTASTNTYAASCFDTLTIIGIDPAVPPTHPTACYTTDSTTSLLVALPPATEYTGTASQYAALFTNGNQLLFVKNDGSQLATGALTASGTVSGANIQLTHALTGASSSDPLGITDYYANHTSTDTFSKIGNQFCSNDWVMKLATTKYSVDASNTSNPKLMRAASNGTTDVIAEQIIGFKVGASLWDNTGSTDNFRFDNTSYNGYDPSQVRSVIVSLIGRTTPNRTGDLNYKNSFDNGNYQIQSLSVVINPRNLSMKDN